MAKRKALSVAENKHASAEVLARFIKHKSLQKAKHVGLYFSVAGEIGTQALIEYCWQQNKKVYLPVLHPFSKGHLLFLAYQQQTKLVSNTFGIPEPQLQLNSVIAANKLDLICTPLVAFDSQGNRLGMGGGYYDRLFAYASKPFRLGLAHEFQWVPSLETQTWDMPLNDVLTPTKHWRF